VVLAALGLDAASALVRQLGGDRALALTVDVTDTAARAALPHVIAARWHVLVTASVYAYVNGMANAPYAVSKAGVEQLGRACAPNSPSTAPPPGCSTQLGPHNHRQGSLRRPRHHHPHARDRLPVPARQGADRPILKFPRSR
jgi:hypothetical protein